MRTLVAIATAALVALGLAGTAHAQSLRAIPEAGPQFCDGMQEFIDMGNEAGPPFSDLAAVGQQIHDGACGGGGGEPEPPDDGEGGEDHPLCPVFQEFINGASEGGAPPELTDGVGQLVEATGCTLGGGGDGDGTTTTTTQADDKDKKKNKKKDDETTTTQAEVGGETETAGGAGGGTLPATGGALGVAAGAGFGFLGLAALLRRYLFS